MSAVETETKPKVAVDISGQVFGSLEALEPIHDGRRVVWRWKCLKCGTTDVIRPARYVRRSLAQFLAGDRSAVVACNPCTLPTRRRPYSLGFTPKRKQRATQKICTVCYGLSHHVKGSSCSSCGLERAA